MPHVGFPQIEPVTKAITLNTKPEGAKEINEGDASNNTDIILNDDPDLIQDNEQSDAPKSSWLEKLKFWKE